jgi:hypothetical protein
MRHHAFKYVHLVRRRAACVVMLAVAACGGCQNFAPSEFSRTRDDAKILKQAENDPFPSPADVGLDQPSTTP